METELQRLVGIRHQNLLATLAAKLTTPSANSSPRLIILMERRPSMTLYDLLEDSDGIREERATVGSFRHTLEETAFTEISCRST